MSARYFLATALFLAGAAHVHAAGINMGWNDCPGGASYALAETFACDTNDGTHTLVVSIVAPAGVMAMTGFSAQINLQTSEASPAAWWDMQRSPRTGCRSTSLGTTFDFTGGPSTCYDYWQGGAIGGNTAEIAFGNRVRLKATAALPIGDSRIGPVPEGTEFYLFSFVINNARTVGPDACAGCNYEACFVPERILLTQVPGTPGGNLHLENPASSYHVIWQGWSTTDPNQQCPAVTPARNRTWGAIKAIYR